jgi:hypothetical protein
MSLKNGLGMLGILAALASGTALASSTPLDTSIQGRVREAELIFQGTVVGVEPRLSDPDAANPHPIPHTFVTYHVDRVLKGAVEGQEITLRFIGGPLDRERYLTVSGGPLFDVGDADVLLVRSNLASECPLVDCGAGRFRMVENLLVSEDGRRFQLSDDGEIAEGPAMKLDAVNRNRMSDTIALERIEVPEPGEVILDPRDPAVRASLDPLHDFTPDRFVTYLDAVVKASHTSEELERSARTPMRSADPRVRFAAWSAPARTEPEEETSAAATSSPDPASPSEPPADASVGAVSDVSAADLSARPGPGLTAWSTDQANLRSLGCAAVLLLMSAALALRWAKRMR